MASEQALASIAKIREEVAEAVNHLMDLVDGCRANVRAVRAGDLSALNQIDAALIAMLETCAFQDLTGQRLSQLAAMMLDPNGLEPNLDPLLNGPAAAGEGLDQTEADALLGTFEGSGAAIAT